MGDTPSMELLLVFSILLLAHGISMVKALGAMMQLYRLQVCLLAVLTLRAAWAPDQTNRMVLVLVAVLLFLLALIIRPVLVNATSKRKPWLMWDLAHLFPLKLKGAENRIWFNPLQSRFDFRIEILLDLSFSLLSFYLAYGYHDSSTNNHGMEPTVLAVIFALLILGLFIMVKKRDMVTQIVGLLVLDQGLFLAAVKVIDHSQIALWFVAALILFVVFTLVILVVLLPSLHQISASLDLGDQKELRG